ncbi:hypothetical protein ERJ75_001225500 [Trypanosoma vivax]|uniref:LSM domain-containing protein n=1 Tax=Trypanosoma vivax (strain Y486) TaxID=1055687 RepID=G0U1A0_TRYVY|nr:hypothetical protein TRVL_02380 [Trypanosoma vivax]KAH8608794.1 hypothetical protein ERJ75_001225500 [Trypanosoma vivax]CCC49855.1 conserved hypothetical protein [Trypanosoma vivax Y486]
MVQDRSGKAERGAKAPGKSRQGQDRDKKKDPAVGMPEVTEESGEPHPFLGREIRIELQDRRVIVGTLIAFLGFGDLLLKFAMEERRCADGELMQRPLSLVAIPMRHVVAMHRRQPGYPLIAVAD